MPTTRYVSRASPTALLLIFYCWIAIAPANAAPADTAFVWIESTDSWLLTTKAKAAEQVVIQSTFVAH